MKRVLLAVLLIAASVCAGWHAHSAREEVKMRNLKATDPELAALWENFVDNDVRPHGSLDARTRHLILLAGHVAAQSPNEYRLVLAAALDDGVSPVEAKEALYQTIPYVGMAKAYDFVLAANEVMDSTASGRTVADDAAKSSGKRTGRPKGNFRLTYR